MLLLKVYCIDVIVESIYIVLMLIVQLLKVYSIDVIVESV